MEPFARTMLIALAVAGSAASQPGLRRRPHLAAREAAIVASSPAEAASAEDRFLMAMGRPQRFGTQSGSDGRPAQPVADGIPESNVRTRSRGPRRLA